MKRGITIKKPDGLVCGALEDNGRTLFLLRKDERGIEKLELPSVEFLSPLNPVNELASEFKRQTGIDGEVHEIVFQSKHNVGSRKRKQWIGVLVFKITAKNRTAKPAEEFSGFKWFSLDDARAQRLGRKLEWLRR